MKIALIIPKNGDGGKSFYDINFVTTFTFSKKYFFYLLAIPTLASLTPPEHEIRVFDENIEPIDFSWDADLAGISVRTMFAPRAFEISSRFRKKGVKSVLGGIHPSVCPDESLKFADCVVIGEAEDVWPQLLKDCAEGKLKKVYQAEAKANLNNFPQPVRSQFVRENYFADIVQTTKGCPFTCEFCSVYYFDGQKIRNRPLDKVLEEVKEVQKGGLKFKKKAVFFADDNIIANKKYSLELFKRLIPLKLNWSCQASIDISKEEEILKKMKEAGCGSIVVGLETISSQSLLQMNKKVNTRHNYLDAIKKIQSHGILVHGSFILGNDFDSLSSFDSLIAFIKKARLLMPLINILTPFPGTKLFERLEKEGRIFSKDWGLYDARHVTFTPANMTPKELNEGYRKVLREVYSFENIYDNLNYYWGINFWKHSNEIDPVKFRFRLLFALRLLTYLGFKNAERNRFIIKVLPRLFNSNVRVSTILNLMAYNDFAYSV